MTKLVGRTDVDPHWTLSDKVAVRRALERLHRYGLHSADAAAGGFTHNVSARVKDLVTDDRIEIRRRQENRGRRPGARYWLAEFAPDDSTPVEPYNAATVGAGLDADTGSGVDRGGDVATATPPSKRSQAEPGDGETLPDPGPAAPLFELPTTGRGYGDPEDEAA